MISGQVVRPVRGLLIDLDGTLIDWGGSVARALSGWLPTLDLPVTADSIALWIGLERRHFPASPQGKSWTEHRRLRLADFLNAHGRRVPPAAELDLAFGRYLEACYRSYQLFPDAMPFLERARAAGITTVVVTNGPQDIQSRKVRDTGLADLVLATVTSEALGVPKPDRRIYEHGLAALGQPADQVLMIGDSVHDDVAGARAAGLHALHLNRQDPGQVCTLDQISFAERHTVRVTRQVRADVSA